MNKNIKSNQIDNQKTKHDNSVKPMISTKTNMHQKQKMVNIAVECEPTVEGYPSFYLLYGYISSNSFERKIQANCDFN
jgi:hypothetical protein